jgi:multidrug transporter EmrE-like cation transporter
MIKALLNDSAFRYAAVMAAFETFGDYNLKVFAKDNLPGNIFAGIAGYAGVVYFFQAALRNEKLFRVNNYWNAMTSVSNTILGVSMGESIVWSQILGVALIVTGILLV